MYRDARVFVRRGRITIVNQFTIVRVFPEGKRLVPYILQRFGNEWVNPPGGAVKVCWRTRERLWEMDDELPKRCGCTAGVNEALQKASCSRWKEHGSGKAALGRFAAAQDRCIFKVCTPAKWQLRIP